MIRLSDIGMQIVGIINLGAMTRYDIINAMKSAQNKPASEATIERLINIGIVFEIDGKISLTDSGIKLMQRQVTEDKEKESMLDYIRENFE